MGMWVRGVQGLLRQSYTGTEGLQGKSIIQGHGTEKYFTVPIMVPAPVSAFISWLLSLPEHFLEASSSSHTLLGSWEFIQAGKSLVKLWA